MNSRPLASARRFSKACADSSTAGSETERAAPLRLCTSRKICSTQAATAGPVSAFSRSSRSRVTASSRSRASARYVLINSRARAASSMLSPQHRTHIWQSRSPSQHVRVGELRHPNTHRVDVLGRQLSLAGPRQPLGCRLVDLGHCLGDLFHPDRLLLDRNRDLLSGLGGTSNDLREGLD